MSLAMFGYIFEAACFMLLIGVFIYAFTAEDDR
jgi:hypothetical protein